MYLKPEPSSTNIWGLLLQRRIVRWSFMVVLALVLLAIIAPWIANEKPIYVSYKNEQFFPASSGDEFADLKNEPSERIYFTDNQFKKLKGAYYLMPLIPYAPNKSDLANADYKSPFENQVKIEDDGSESLLSGFEKHLLGTGKRGEDLLSGLIHGTRVSLTVGIFAMIIAGFLGICLGSLSGFFGDQELKVNRGNLWMVLLGVIPSWYYSFQLRAFMITDALQISTVSFIFQLLISLIIFCMLIGGFFFMGKLLNQISFFKKQVYVPVDTIISKAIEVITSLPRLILIISIAAIARPSLTNLILIIGLTSWTEIARFTRAEMFRIRNLEYIQSAETMGFSKFRIIFKHALPNAIAPALVAISFGIASAILIESGLSFLGIGVPQNTVTWGSLLAAGKENFSAWWLVVFPGIAIFLTVTVYNLIGEALREAMDPKLRR